MPGLLPHVDPDGLLEFSVVYTDRALNHMSRRFQGVMTDISAMLKRVYGARSAVLVPGSGTFGILFSLFVVVIAALNLVLDFDFIEEGAERGAPKYMEWYAAFGLMVTLIWLYLEILRLLAKLQQRR